MAVAQDFRQLNKLVIPECQPFPRIEDIIEKTVNCEFFTTLDINSAFWAISVRIEDREKLAIPRKSIPMESFTIWIQKFSTNISTNFVQYYKKMSTTKF